VYGIDIPPVVKFRNGYEQGAKYINPDINLLGVYIDSFTAPDRGAALAEQLIGEGADVIFGAGGPTGSGGIAFAAAQGVKVIGVDQDEYFTTFQSGETTGSEFLISSALKRVDIGVYDMIEALVEGEGFPGALYILSTTNGGITFAPAHDADVPEEVTAQIEELEAMLADGSLSTGVDPVTGDLLDMEMMETPEASG
jgi:basic membrane lipoprotein Med (substrate-binding protein (PBP1-ABC) superfamily)